MTKPLILYFYPNDASYVRKDLRILSERYRLRTAKAEPSRKWLLPWMLVYQKLICLWYFKAEFIVCQFAGYHSLIPVIMGRILGIKSIVILGGSDCASFPEIHYGNFRKKLLGWFTCQSIRRADVLSPVHEKMIGYDYTYENFRHKRQGYSAFCKPGKAKVNVIYNGFDTDGFVRNEGNRKKDFIAIATYNRDAVYYLKGIDLIEQAAERFPQTSFTIVGVSAVYLQKPKPANVNYLPFLPQNELMQLLNEHYFYCQLSISEGFPNALCEAMLCGCVPLVSAVCSMPDIVGNTGFVLERRDPELLAVLIAEMLALNDPDALSLAARKRVTEHYRFDQRRDQLLRLLDEVGS